MLAASSYSNIAAFDTELTAGGETCRPNIRSILISCNLSSG
jgi:hypothetical protein